MSVRVKRLIILTIMLFTLNVKADEVYFRNKNNVGMTKSQYDFFTNLYWDGYQEFVEESEYNELLTGGYFDNEVKTTSKEYNSEYSGKATFHETTAKQLQLSAACSSDNLCIMTTTLTWKGNPNVKSYDVIGSFMYGGNFERIDTPTTRLYYGSNSITFTDRVYSGSGWGCTVLLPKTDHQMIITQTVTIKLNGKGTYYSSYQHATEKITLETSKKYTVGYGGYGGVFFFYGSAKGVYDQMGGVDTFLTPQ